MVIKRSWRTTGPPTETAPHQTSSSEDSNSSWQTISSSATSAPLRQNMPTGRIAATISNEEMATSVLKALKNRYNGRSSKQQSDLEIASNSIELMRVNIQDAFDKEIDVIVTKYVQTFFKPAIKNIKENLDSSILCEDYLMNISKTLLENAKLQYIIKPEIANEVLVFDKDVCSIKKEIDAPCKRKDTSSSEDENNSTASPIRQPIKKFAMTMQSPIKTIFRAKPSLWNVSSLTQDTMFVLDYKANRALGFVDNYKDRLSSQHPELMRYLTDSNDKEWLIHKRILSPSHKSFRILLLLMDDVHKIAQTGNYQSRNLKLSELVGFKLPDFMLQKMRMFFHELNKKHRNMTMGPSIVITSANSALGPITISSGGIRHGQIKLVSSLSAARSSSLSSTHATLSALLSNSADNSTSTASAQEDGSSA